MQLHKVTLQDGYGCHLALPDAPVHTSCVEKPKKHWSYFRGKWCSASGSRSINGFVVFEVLQDSRAQWKRMYEVRMSESVRCGRDAVRVARKALGKAVKGKRLVGEPAQMRNPEGA